jgi:hypothetical protein
MYYHIEPNHSSYKFIHKTGQVFNSIEHSYIMFIPDTNRTDVTLQQAVTVWWLIIYHRHCRWFRRDSGSAPLRKATSSAELH